ncbi:hypothetical protein JCM3770_000338 [Rhodotorula araucariae]
MDSSAFSAAALHGPARRGQRESSYHPMASDSGSDGEISDGDPPDYAGGPRPAPIAPPPSLGAGGGAPKKRSFDELEDIVFSNPRSFVSLAKDIADARNVPLMIGDDRTHKVSSAYMHVHCAYRRAGCPFIIKLTKAKEGGWLIRGSKAPELDPKQRSSYRCRHPAGSKPDLNAGTSMAAWLGAADRTTSHPEGGARPKAAKARSVSGTAGAAGDYGVRGGGAPPLDSADAREPSAAGKAPRASGRGGGVARNGGGGGGAAAAGRPALAPGAGGGIGPERALAPPFQRAIDRQAQIVPALSPQHQQPQQQAYGSQAGYSPRPMYGYAPSTSAHPAAVADGPYRYAGTSPPPSRIPLVAVADPSALPDWTALLTLVGDGDLLPLARVLASPLVACTPASFFAESRQARGRLLDALPSEATGLWPKIKLASRLGGEEGERAWARMGQERRGSGSRSSASGSGSSGGAGSRSASEGEGEADARSKLEEEEDAAVTLRLVLPRPRSLVAKTMSALGLSFAQQVKSSRGLYKALKPLADKYANLAAYRGFGLRYDDLVIEESASVQKALGRLSERDAYDRAFRLRTASMCAIAHEELPKAQWVKPSEDVRYLKPIIQEVEAEDADRSAFDHATRA